MILGVILILPFVVGLPPWLLGFVLLLLDWCLSLLFHWIVHGRLRVVRSMFTPGALRGIKASFLAEAGLRKLRAAIVRFVWSRRQSLASPGAVLSSLDGPVGCDLAFCCGSGSVLLRRLLAYWPCEVARVCIGFWNMLLLGALVMVLLTCLLKAPLRLGFVWVS